MTMRIKNTSSSDRGKFLCSPEWVFLPVRVISIDSKAEDHIVEAYLLDETGILS